MILIDNNISPRIKSVLAPVYRNMLHVVDVGLDDKDDFEIWKYAHNNLLHIITKDGDFNHMLQLKGFPPKIIWLRTGNSTTKKIITLLQVKEQEIKAFLKNTAVGILEIY